MANGSLGMRVEYKRLQLRLPTYPDPNTRDMIMTSSDRSTKRSEGSCEVSVLEDSRLGLSLYGVCYRDLSVPCHISLLLVLLDN